MAACKSAFTASRTTAENGLKYVVSPHIQRNVTVKENPGSLQGEDHAHMWKA